MKKYNTIIILVMLCLLCLFTFSYSLYNVLKWKRDANGTNEQIEYINEETVIHEVEDNDNTIIINDEEDISEDDPYWSFISMNMLDVDFSELKNINSSVVGWLKVNGTNINYPFVQTTDNKYYLNHGLDKKYNSAGWLFMDYRNDIETSKNTIIYAHGRIDKTMFGTLRNVLKSSWYKNQENYVIRISTEKENSLWQIFSTYHIETTSDYIQTEFSTNREYQEFLDMIKNRSTHDFNTSVSFTDRILTLSTCYSKTEKMVVHAKLIKKEVKTE